MDSYDPHLVELQHIPHASGQITVAETEAHLPFLVERVYFLHGLRADSERGAHAHLQLKQMLVAVQGSFRVDLEGPTGRKSFRLDNPNQGLIVQPLNWRDLNGFSDDAICLVLASDRYNEADYIRDYGTFHKLMENFRDYDPSRSLRDEA